MIDQNENFINYNSKNKIIIIEIILVFFLIFFIIIFIIILENRTSDNCVSMNISNFNRSSGLVLYFHFNNETKYREDSTFVYDFSGNRNHGRVYGATWNSKGGKGGDGAFEFLSSKNSINVDDSDSLSPSTFGQNFTISFWVKFDKTVFVGEGSKKDYINFLGKGNSDDGQEFVFRYFNSSNSEGKDNRISFYAFNQEGLLGAGSYVQEKIIDKEWIYLTGVINGTHIKIYKNGVLVNSNPLSEYNISMKNTKSDFYIGKTIGKDYFKGSIDELRIYNRILDDCEVKDLYNFDYWGENNEI